MEKWKDFSHTLRKSIVNCQWCGTHKFEHPLGYLECHHLGSRGFKRSRNPDYVLCPLNIIVVCQDCHKLLEPFAKIKVQLILTDDFGKEIKEVECCGKGSACRRMFK
jgi:hypothetical protein